MNGYRREALEPVETRCRAAFSVPLRIRCISLVTRSASGALRQQRVAEFGDDGEVVFGKRLSVGRSS